MMTQEDLRVKNALNKLQGGGGISIDKGKLIENYCTVEFKDSLDACDDPEKKSVMMKRYTSYYAEGDGKDFMDNMVSKLQNYTKQAMDSVKELRVSSVKITASNAVPAVITTGSATSVPNPAYFVIDNSQKKNTLLTLIKGSTNILAKVLESAMMVHWKVPNEIIALVEALNVIAQVVKNIP